MLGYICKYAPIEVFEAFGEEVKMIEPLVNNFNHADTLMHPNICSFAKGVLEDVIKNQYEGVILTTCCDSVRRLFDVLKNRFPDKFIYMIDVPRKVNDFSVEIYVDRIKEMTKAYSKFSGKEFDFSRVLEIVKQKSDLCNNPASKNANISINNSKNDAANHLIEDSNITKLKIGISGARLTNEVLDLIKSKGVDIVYNITCSSLDRDFYKLSKNPLPYKEAIDISTNEADENSKPTMDFSDYASSLLNQIPCMRMVEAVNRNNYVENLLDEVDGIIFHTVKFCDNYSFDYASLKAHYKKPVLHIETDMTNQSEGQVRTRIEAFLESIRPNTNIKKINHEGNTKMYVLGIDSGSTSTNAVILNENKEIVAFHVLRTGAKSISSAEKARDEVIKKAGLKPSDITKIVATGYGRVSIPFADENITEISCHGKGAHYFNPEIRTILDIGGQDSKAIRLNEDGSVIDFAMNDKCAAGTGRFLEMMARTLEISVDDLGPISKNWKEDIEISNMCTVFAESEVISLIAKNKEKADIVHGLHKSIANKAYSLIQRVGVNPKFMMTGGVAKNAGVVCELEKLVDSPIFICDEPEIVGAVGAALSVFR